MKVGGGKAGENSLNSRLAGLLKEIGFKSADFELLFPTFRGQAKPDVSFSTTRGVVVISAKLGNDKEVDALSAAQEYQQNLGKSESLAETFAVVYPNDKEKKFILRVLATDLHGSLSWTFKELEEVATKVAEVVRKDWEKAHSGSEHPDEASIRVLRSGVDSLTTTLTGTSVDDFKALFGGSNLFESILGYEKSARKTENELLRSAASYLFVNQILFYEILSRELRKDYPEISEEDYEKPEILGPKYFALVLKKDYTPIFGFDIATRLGVTRGRSACKKIILAIKALFPRRIEHDVIGKVFHNMIPLDVRKRVAAYFTNSQAADLLAKLTIRSDEAIVMDPACGSGTLLVASYKQKLLLSGGKQTRNLHRQFIERDLTGIDIMPFSAHLAAVHLALLAPLYETENVRIAIEDSTEHFPGDEIDPVKQQLKTAFGNRLLSEFMENATRSAEKTKRGVVSLKSATRQIKLAGVDVIIMNPPFTSNANLPNDYKRDLEKRFTGRPYSECITGKLSFQAYFLLLADRFLKDGGLVASVLPLTTFVAKAFNKIDDFLLTNYSVRYIVVSLGRSAFSDNTALMEILFIAKKEKPSPGNKFVLVGTKKSANQWSDADTEALERQITNSFNQLTPSNSSLCITNISDQDSLRQTKDGLLSLISRLDDSFVRVENMIREIYSQSTIMITLQHLEKKLGCEFFAYELRIKGGSYYGYSALSIVESEDRALKKTDVLIYKEIKDSKVLFYNRNTSEIQKAPTNAVRRQLRRLSGLEKIDVSGLNEFVIQRAFDGLEQIIESIFPMDLARTYIKRINSDWANKVVRGSSIIVLARKINLSAPGTTVLCVYSEIPTFMAADSWGIRSISKDDAKILTLWFNSTLFLIDLLSKRAPTQGAYGRFDEHLLFKVSVPDLSAISTQEKEKLLIVFDEIKDARFPSLLDQLANNHDARRKIDTGFLGLMGVSPNRQYLLLKNLYPIVYRKLMELKETMRFD